MYIAPNSIVRVLSGVPIDSNYAHTLYFSTQSAQQSYFASKAKYSYTNQSYVRYGRGQIRVEQLCDNLYDCNYLMFQNTAFGNKWFYAFIDNIEYINNSTTQINYTIDVLQSWHFDYVIEQCFVAREHPPTDNIGDNTQPENLELGEYVCGQLNYMQALEELSIVVAATFDSDYNDAVGDIYGGIYSGLHYTVFDNTVAGVESLNTFLSNVGVKASGIVSIFMMPKIFVTGRRLTSVVVNIPVEKNQISLGTYTPRNKKLLTYPYNFLYVTNNQGAAAHFKYEFFSSAECNFQLTGDMSCSPSVIMYPQNYKASGNNVNEKITLSGYPQLSYNIDTYKAWVAQESSKLLGNLMSTPLTFALTGNPLTLTGTVSQAVNLGTQISVHDALQMHDPAYTVPMQSSGATGSLTMVAAGLINFLYTNMHIRPEYAQIIDGYFDLYGYAVNRLKVPTRVSRPIWNYVKTIGCEINGTLPSDDKRIICEIHDRGVTYWHDPTKVGDYSGNNAPVEVTNA